MSVVEEENPSSYNIGVLGYILNIYIELLELPVIYLSFFFSVERLQITTNKRHKQIKLHNYTKNLS